jgi:cytochrome c biogenesis protein CcdA/thiol-disulfide isomerase/thioredoxin
MNVHGSVLFVLAYLGGVLTILSPCILPVLPFVFARAGQSFLRTGLPMLTGMALSFAAIGSLAAVGGAWAVRTNEIGRAAALVLLAAFGCTLLFPALATQFARPFVAAGNRISQRVTARNDSGSFWWSAVLGVATGLLWAPCAGPILGLLLTGAAVSGVNAYTALLLLTYAAGAATSIAVVLLVGERVYARLRASMGVSEWVRRALGVAVLVSVVAIAFGLDATVLTRASTASTSYFEQRLIDAIRPSPAMAVAQSGLPVEGRLPPLRGAATWVNSPPLTVTSLRGKVVLIDFWTYSCINCLRALPYVQAWADKYRSAGLVVIGVHTPEFAFEHDANNVRGAVRRLGITFPVAIDNDYTIWRAFDNEYWPADYLADAQGRIRYHHFGEGDYRETDAAIRALLAEAGHAVSSGTKMDVSQRGDEMAADASDLASPETYIGYARADNFASPGGETGNRNAAYRVPDHLALNQWALGGYWNVSGQYATSLSPGGRIAFRFHARDLHLVLGPATRNVPVRFKVTIDGKAPGADHGVDTDARGYGVVTDQRLYQLVRQKRPVANRTFEIEFLDAGAQAFSFTFG